MEFFFSNNIENDVIILDSFESRHCAKVMRHQIGDTINVVDGLGNLYVGSLDSINKKSCKIKINNVFNEYNKRNHYLHIGISPIKNHDRLEWFVEKSVEIGIDEISLINCSRTLRKKAKINRLNKTAVTAMKQSLKAYSPKINDIISLEEFVKKNTIKNNFICHLDDQNRKSIFSYKNSIINKNNCCMIIGPEGDFTASEVEFCKNNNFNPITLGETRYRTETAGIIACHLVNILNC